MISGLAIARCDGAAALGPGVAVPGEYAGRTLISMPSDIVAGTANDCRPPIRRQGNRRAKQVLRLTVTGREGGTALDPVATVLDEHPSGTLVGVRADVVTPTTDNCGRTIGRQGGYAIKAIVRLAIDGRRSAPVVLVEGHRERIRRRDRFALGLARLRRLDRETCASGRAVQHLECGRAQRRRVGRGQILVFPASSAMESDWIVQVPASALAGNWIVA